MKTPKGIINIENTQLTDMREDDTHIKHHDRWLRGEHKVWVSYCREEDGILTIIERTPINFN